MSLRRRIGAAAAVAVAVVAVALSITGYFSTRSALINQVRTDLRDQAQRYVQRAGQPLDHGGFGEPNQGGQGGFPGPPGPGGAAGYIQVVNPDGTVHASGPYHLPVTSQVRDIVSDRGGSVYFSTTVGGHHEEVYAVWDPGDQHVVMVAEPLTDADSVLDGLLLTYGLLIVGGVALAALLGFAISRSALRPIERFVAQTERATQTLDRPARLEATDAVELQRLAASFNQTIDALERSIEAQRHLVADASHELRTPIAALRSNIQIFLEAERLPVGERVELQDSILAELDELTQIVADVMELARGSGPDLHSEDVELDTIVRETVERAQRRAPGLRFNLELEPTIVPGVPERIGRAVTNVIDNARKWSPPDGEVEIQLRDGVLSVRDHGPGFGETDLPHVFDRFYRATRARRMPGSGLGLAIVKQAAESHGGYARAANAPDGGAMVTVSFGPARAVPQAPPIPVAAPPEPTF
ncbi:MAG TPA: HAMP domain-containing sensor histidine kinase [Solirubrobacteraceae bacterium]|nr:HAMP domain-containing sensor histidine kinase [Solirubrobacteraceae bacterium]